MDRIKGEKGNCWDTGTAGSGRRTSSEADMSPVRAAEAHTAPVLDRVLQRIIAETLDGLRHGHFEFKLTCEIIGQERRRLTLWAGKSYQFVIYKEDCLTSALATPDSRDGSDAHAA